MSDLSSDAIARDGMTADEAIEFSVKMLIQAMRDGEDITPKQRDLIAQAAIALVTLQRDRIQMYRIAASFHIPTRPLPPLPNSDKE